MSSVGLAWTLQQQYGLRVVCPNQIDSVVKWLRTERSASDEWTEYRVISDQIRSRRSSAVAVVAEEHRCL